MDEVLAATVTELLFTADEATVARIDWHEAHVHLIQLREQRQQVEKGFAALQEAVDEAEHRAARADERLAELAIEQVTSTAYWRGSADSLTATDAVTFERTLGSVLTEEGR